MIKEIFNEIKNEARSGRVNLTETVYNENIVYPLYIKFNIVDDKIVDDMPNLYIKNENNFYEKLKLYISIFSKLYNIKLSKENIKEIISRLLVNISNSEMNYLEGFIDKYISFLTNSKINNEEYIKFVNEDVGSIKSTIELQSINQETPFCFKSKFIKDNLEYNLARISFGIKDKICYIYAIQNKDKNIITDNNIEYFNTVKSNIRTINKSINKYRNVTPSFVVALTNFLNYMNINGITKFKVVSSLPIRINNREKTTNLKIESKSFNLTKNELENFKEVLISNKIRDNYQATVGFTNNFNRLKIHFYECMNILPTNIDDNIYFEINNLITKTPFLEMVVNNNEDMIKYM